MLTCFHLFSIMAIHALRCGVCSCVWVYMHSCAVVYTARVRRQSELSVHLVSAKAWKLPRMPLSHPLSLCGTAGVTDEHHHSDTVMLWKDSRPSPHACIEHFTHWAIYPALCSSFVVPSLLVNFRVNKCQSSFHTAPWPDRDESPARPKDSISQQELAHLCGPASCAVQCLVL